MSDKLSEANSVKCEAQVCIGMVSFLHDAFLFIITYLHV